MIHKISLPIKEVKYPIWISVSEAAGLGGVGDKTIRRAIKTDSNLRYMLYDRVMPPATVPDSVSPVSKLPS